MLLLWRRVDSPLTPPIRAAVGVSAGLVALFLGLLAGGAVAFGFDFRDGQTLLMFQLLRVMFPYVLLVCIAAVFMGMLNARGHFFVPAMGATMLNVVMIASVLLLAPRMGSTLDKQIFGLAMGVVLVSMRCNRRGDQHPQEDRQRSDQPDLFGAEAPPRKPHREIGYMRAVDKKQRGKVQPDPLGKPRAGGMAGCWT